MSCIIFSYDWTSRDLKKTIISLLKSANATNIKKFNYVHDFSLDVEWKVKKKETKLVMIESNNEKRLLLFLEKNFPSLKRVKLNLSDNSLWGDSK